MILLNEEEIRMAYGSVLWHEGDPKAVAKAQLKKVVDKIEEVSKCRRTTSKHRVNYITLSRKMWQAILEEIK
ncbi:hypothetical protein LCGC14_0477070 [marine sediment metagenome]|uniref:Uncharacterized protein n=1 Tax=marine sediment metagenome TaxID=412755 RepID=A0A0F9SAG9_9ZZZZ